MVAPMHWFFTVILLLAGQASSPQALDIRSIFVSDNLQWRPQPGKLKSYAYRSTSGTLLIFRTDGEFDRFEGTLVRQQPHGTISIDYHRSYKVSVGTWKRHGNDELRVTSRVIFVTIPKVGEAIPGPDMESTWAIHGQANDAIGAAIEGSGKRYIPLRSISDEEAKALDQVIRLHSKEASSHPPS